MGVSMNFVKFFCALLMCTQSETAEIPCNLLFQEWFIATGISNTDISRIACICYDSLEKKFVCDNIENCPLGIDEKNCSRYCKNDMYPCYGNEVEMNKNETTNMCYPIKEKCNGVKYCANGVDEEKCSMLVRKEDSCAYVPYAEGFLYRNYRGVWYPAFDFVEEWINEACEAVYSANELIRK